MGSMMLGHICKEGMSGKKKKKKGGTALSCACFHCYSFTYVSSSWQKKIIINWTVTGSGGVSNSHTVPQDQALTEAASSGTALNERFSLVVFPSFKRPHKKSASCHAASWWVPTQGLEHNKRCPQAIWGTRAPFFFHCSTGTDSTSWTSEGSISQPCSHKQQMWGEKESEWDWKLASQDQPLKQCKLATGTLPL